MIIVSYQVDLYLSTDYGNASEDEPVEVCHYIDDGDDYYGYRVCMCMIAAGVINILLCMMLLTIDLFNPCLNSGVSIATYLYVYVNQNGRCYLYKFLYKCMATGFCVRSIW